MSSEKVEVVGGRNGAISSGVAGGGIPKAVFVVSKLVEREVDAYKFLPSPSPSLWQDDVDAFMKQQGSSSAETVIKQFDELYRKYKFMEANLTQKKKRYWWLIHFPTVYLLLGAEGS